MDLKMNIPSRGFTKSSVLLPGGLRRCLQSFSWPALVEGAHRARLGLLHTDGLCCFRPVRSGACAAHRADEVISLLRFVCSLRLRCL